MLTNKRERWELFDVDAGIETQVPALPTSTLPNPTTMQQPGLEMADTKTKTSTSKDKIKFLIPEGIHPSAISVIQAAG